MSTDSPSEWAPGVTLPISQWGAPPQILTEVPSGSQTQVNTEPRGPLRPELETPCRAGRHLGPGHPWSHRTGKGSLRSLRAVTGLPAPPCLSPHCTHISHGVCVQMDDLFLETRSTSLQPLLQPVHAGTALPGPGLAAQRAPLPTCASQIIRGEVS